MVHCFKCVCFPLLTATVSGQSGPCFFPLWLSLRKGRHVQLIMPEAGRNRDGVPFLLRLRQGPRASPSGSDSLRQCYAVWCFKEFQKHSTDASVPDAMWLNGSAVNGHCSTILWRRGWGAGDVNQPGWTCDLRGLSPLTLFLPTPSALCSPQNIPELGQTGGGCALPSLVRSLWTEIRILS